MPTHCSLRVGFAILTYFGGSIEPDEEELAEANRWANLALEQAVAGLANDHPHVEVRARSVKGVVENALLQECEHAELLVVERHRQAQRPRLDSAR